LQKPIELALCQFASMEALYNFMEEIADGTNAGYN